MFHKMEALSSPCLGAGGLPHSTAQALALANQSA
eukprot:COSAG01_NODE_66870_length_268_cov_2.130178_1_plen_33_part_01